MVSLWIPVCLAALVVGCGQKGPLVLPDAPKHKKTLPSPRTHAPAGTAAPAPTNNPAPTSNPAPASNPADPSKPADPSNPADPTPKP